MDIFLVGGAVRDQLLGVEVLDRDWVVVGGTPEQMTKLGYKPVGKDFPVFIDPKSGEEYALARTERKTDRGYKGFSFNTSADITLEEDLKRRDLTINAIAKDSNGELIDPFLGQSDIKHKILRHVSEAFIEDPVRVLRVARFAARFDFSVAPETMSLMKQMVENGEVDALVAERVWGEFNKALKAGYPSRFIDVLKECGALKKVLPEIDALFGIPQHKEYHPEIDTGIHTIMVLQQAAKLTDNAIVRFAALVHDLGKAKTPKHKWPSHYGHEKLGVDTIQTLCSRLRIPNKYKELACIVSEYHLHMHRLNELKASTILKLLELTGSLRNSERAEQFVLACEADARGRTGLEERDYPQKAQFFDYLAAANSVDTTNIAKKIESDSTEHHHGEKIKAAISSARLQAIELSRKTRNSN